MSGRDAFFFSSSLIHEWIVGNKYDPSFQENFQSVVQRLRSGPATGGGGGGYTAASGQKSTGSGISSEAAATNGGALEAPGGKSLAHVLSKTVLDASDALTQPVEASSPGPRGDGGVTVTAMDSPADALLPVATVLRNLGLALEKSSHARDEMETRVLNEFVYPITETLEAGVANAQRARKQAQKARLDLDSVKAKLRYAKAEKIEQLSAELHAAEEAFTIAVEDALISMKSLVENPNLSKQERRLNYLIHVVLIDVSLLDHYLYRVLECIPQG